MMACSNIGTGEGLVGGTPCHVVAIGAAREHLLPKRRFHGSFLLRPPLVGCGGVRRTVCAQHGLLPCLRSKRSVFLASLDDGRARYGMSRVTTSNRQVVGESYVIFFVTTQAGPYHFAMGRAPIGDGRIRWRSRPPTGEKAMPTNPWGQAAGAKPNAVTLRPRPHQIRLNRHDATTPRCESAAKNGL